MKELFILIIVIFLGIGLIYNFIFSSKINLGEERFRFHFIQEREEQKEEADPYTISLLKQIRGKVEGWLKAINERIEKEDVTRLEVRFLEILRSLLEWLKDKIDSKLESMKEKKPKIRQEIFREANTLTNYHIFKG